MNQELMTLDFWQDTVIYEGKTFPVGTLACDALNVPANTIAKMNEQCEKINLLLGILNAGQDASALCPMAKEAALTMFDILSKHRRSPIWIYQSTGNGLKKSLLWTMR